MFEIPKSNILQILSAEKKNIFSRNWDRLLLEINWSFIPDRSEGGSLHKIAPVFQHLKFGLRNLPEMKDRLMSNKGMSQCYEKMFFLLFRGVS